MRYLKKYDKLFESEVVHLKSYKIFEYSSEYIKDYLNDIFLELEDEGYDVSIKDSTSNFHSSAANCRDYKVIISSLYSGLPGNFPTPTDVTYKNSSKIFKLSDIFDLVLTTDSYMNDNGWSIYDIRFRTPLNEWFTLNKSDIEKLKNPESLKKEIHDINYIELTFKSK